MTVPVDASLSQFTETIEDGESWPRPLCSKCQAGYLRFAKPKMNEDTSSIAAHEHPGWDVEWIRGTFVCEGTCENPECGVTAYATGTYEVGYATHVDFDATHPYSGFYTVGSVYPPPLMMSIPATAPEPVRDGIVRASSVLLTAPGLAATALRGTVERFLTTEGVQRKTPNGGFRTLEQRLVDWTTADGAEAGRKQVGQMLSAVKWLGNAGTHENADLTVPEVLEGATLLDEAFHRWYKGPDLDGKALAIIQAKGPKRSQ